MIRRALVLALVVLTTGCATTRVLVPSVPAAEADARQDQREQVLRATRDWGFDGRVAVTNGQQGGSGRIEWRQSGDHFDVTLSAPITRQSWRLSGDPSGARLEGVEGGPREGADAEALLREATGWSIPVRSLGAWLRALRAPGSPARVVSGPDGRPSRIEQDGWGIDYSWPPGNDPQALPTRIDARRETARVRLAIDRWNDGSP